MKGAAEFCLDWLVDDGTGHLVTAPSTSPEIDFFTADHKKASVTIGSTMDLSIIRDLFTNCLEAAKVLGIDDDFTRAVADARGRLLPLQVGSRGQLQEWAKDLQETDVHHRHTSHLFGVYPGREITPATPKLFQAAQRSLEIRGDDGTGWALGWRINLWARFRDGDHAYLFVRNLLRPVGDTSLTNYRGGGGVYPNLFDAHPPFQIDGNFAFTAGVSEMLLQSHLGSIDLLPALPTAWPYGSVRGLRARGGYEVGLEWKDGKLGKATLRNVSAEGPGRVRCGTREIELTIRRGETVTLDGSLKKI
jgi:alpha-L-fucosidase 2